MYDKNWLVVPKRWTINRKKQSGSQETAMQIEIFLALLVFAFTTSITPGPNNMMLFASGVNFGFVRTIPHMCGIGVGFLVLLLAVGFGLGGPCDRPVEAAPRFSAGARVRTRNFNPTTHTRLPRYARGKVGVVETVQGSFVFPDDNAHGKGESPQWVYTVVFEGGEIWGEGAAPGLTVSIDAWESYLEPV